MRDAANRTGKSPKDRALFQTAGPDANRTRPLRETVAGLAEGIVRWMADLQVREPGYDQGGIFDPLDGRVVGDHYATTHFAWALALWGDLFPNVSLPGSLDAALDFHLRTSPGEYPPGKWSYHWDFNNLAMIETFALLRGRIEDQRRLQWGEALRAWKTNAHWAVNWVAMRAQAAFLRHDLQGVQDDRKEAEKWLAFVLASQRADGGLDDVPGRSLPAQYHAYTACLLHAMVDRDRRVAPAVIRAARWLLALCAPDGEVNAVGRGQGQIFGYACAVYLFLAAAELDPALAPRYRLAARTVARRLADFRDRAGFLPLTLNRLPVEERAGWYDYHHLSVYNAFAAVWLLRAAALVREGASAEPLPIAPPSFATPPLAGATLATPPLADTTLATPPPADTTLADSGLLSLRRERYFALFSSGQEGAGYATEPGVTPHLLEWGQANIFRHPLGPGEGKYGERARKEGQAQHCWAPLWRDGRDAWQAPALARGALRKSADGSVWRMELFRDGAHWRRDLVAGQRFLEANDTLTAPGAQELREVNLALAEADAWDIGPEWAFQAQANVVLRSWGEAGTALEAVGEVSAAQGRTTVLARRGHAPSGRGGWRLRQGPSCVGGSLPGIVCLSWDPWSDLWKRKQRLMAELAASGRAGEVLYVEPPLPCAELVEGLPRALRGDARLRRGLTPGAVRMHERLSVLTPVMPLPGQRTFPALAERNRRLWRAQLARAVSRQRYAQGYVLWLYHPDHLEALSVLSPQAELVVYDWTDDWVAALPAGTDDKRREQLARRQDELLRRADVVFAVSQALCRKAQTLCPFVHHLPNATDTETFRPAAPGEPAPAVLADKPRPVLLYLSQITPRLDVDLLADLARMRPDWTILLAGPLVCDASLLDPLRPLPNVFHLGAVPYREAGRLTAHADVCLLPHREDALTRTLDPIKLYDYLAAGRPVVSTRIALHPDLAPHVRQAHGAREFAAAVDQALSEGSGPAQARQRAAAIHGWPARAAQATDILERFFPEDE